MRYFVTFDGPEIPVDVTAVPGGGYDVRLDGERVDADVVALPDALSIRIGNRVIDLVVEGTLPELGVSATGMRARVRVESERGRAASAARRKLGPETGAVASPMPGRIVKVLVELGAEVQADQPLVVVEAMKMENELRAPKGGKIAKIAVQAGDRVEAGTILLEVD
ncbi:MAG: biotin/lipoyl-binding protein [Deltaproteobacteria bacterium]|nr:biotin/lipoyl-binding protein [Deltaproteobacteria bacterium]